MLQVALMIVIKWYFISILESNYKFVSYICVYIANSIIRNFSQDYDTLNRARVFHSIIPITFLLILKDSVSN